MKLFRDRGPDRGIFVNLHYASFVRRSKIFNRKGKIQIKQNHGKSQLPLKRDVEAKHAVNKRFFNTLSRFTRESPDILLDEYEGRGTSGTPGNSSYIKITSIGKS